MTIDSLVNGHSAPGDQLMKALPVEERSCLVNGLRRLILTLERTTREGEHVEG